MNNNSSTYSQYFPKGIGLPISLTRTQAQTLASNSTIQNGQLYWITDATTNTIADFGVMVFGQPDGKSFSLKGFGGFLNADYQNVGNYDVTGILGDINVGVWQAANEGASIYNGIITIWNGYHYQCINDAAFDGKNPDTNTTAYQFLPRVAPNVGYITEWDDVEYDFANDWIQSREDRRGNKVKVDFNQGSTLSNNPFSKFQWGNTLVANNTVLDSVFNILNNVGDQIYGNTLTGFSDITADLGIGIVLKYCTFNNAVADLSAMTVAYSGKTLSPYLSTFDITVDISGVGIGYTLPLPDYIGKITLYSELLGDDIGGFSTNPSFPLRINIGASSNPISFSNGSNLVFPIPSVGTVLTGNAMDFIEFEFSYDSGNFYQTASEQY